MVKRIDHLTEIRVVNVLCNATTSQQAATRELTEEVDLMIVVGGYNSANTRHLAEVSRANGVETHHVETAAELQDEWFRGHEDVGVTAGASTPDFSIDAVADRDRADRRAARGERLTRLSEDATVRGELADAQA